MKHILPIYHVDHIVFVNYNFTSYIKKSFIDHLSIIYRSFIDMLQPLVASLQMSHHVTQQLQATTLVV